MEYHKIHTLFKRTPKGEMILGDWTDPVFEYLSGCPWRMTEKIDGTNIRIMINDEGQVSYGGRTDTAQLPNKLVAWMMQHFDGYRARGVLHEKFPDGAILYGEGYGAGIQKGGGNYRPDQRFILFDVRVGDWWLQHQDVIDVAQTLALDMVAVVGETTLHEGIEMVSKGIKSRFGNFPAEGVVAQPMVPLFNRKGERVITKIKTKDWERAVPKE